MRKTALLLAILVATFCASTSLAVSGTGEVQVNTGTTVAGAIAANTSIVIVGWTPVVNSMSASFGSINAYVNAQGMPFASVGMSQSVTAHIGQFTAAAGPPIILYPAWQHNGAFNLTNNTGATTQLIFGCVGGAVTGACLFNVRSFPTTDPLF